MKSLICLIKMHPTMDDLSLRGEICGNNDFKRHIKLNINTIPTLISINSGSFESYLLNICAVALKSNLMGQIYWRLSG